MDQVLTLIKSGQPVAVPIKLLGRDREILESHELLSSPFPLYGFFRPMHEYFYGLLGVHEFFYIKFSLARIFFCTSPASH